MAAACFQLHNYHLFEKVGLKLGPLTQNSVQQDYLPGNSLLTKNIKKLLHLPGVDCPPFTWTFMGNPEDGGGGGGGPPPPRPLGGTPGGGGGGGGRILPKSQEFTHFLHQKNLT